MKLNAEQENILSGKEGSGVQKAMEILVSLGEAVGAEKMQRISYAHLMPPEVMFFPYGKQGRWAREMTGELIKDIRGLKVFATIEPKFCNLNIAGDLQFSDDQVEEMKEIQEEAVKFYEGLGVLPTYTAMPFYYYQAKFGQHVSIAESIATLWFNSIFGSRSERDDGITSLAAAITGYIPLSGAHLEENRYAEVIVRLGKDIDLQGFNDADWDVYSLAASKACKEKRPAFVDIPPDIGITALKHLLAVIAVESGLAVMHIVGLSPEAKTLSDALAGHTPQDDIVIGRREFEDAYQLVNTAEGSDIDFILMGCPHLTLRELRDVAEVLEGKKVHENVTLIMSTTRFLLEQAEDLGYATAITKAGGVLTTDMCIAFAGSQVSGTIATNSIKAVFFYAGFCATSPNKVRFGSSQDCARSALTGKWEGRV